MSDFFSKMRVRRTVLKRTGKRPDLPETILYMGGDGGDGKRAVLDPSQKEHRIADAVLQSHYKVASGSEAETLIAAHWAKLAAASPATARKP